MSEDNVVQFLPRTYDPRHYPQRQRILESDKTFAQRVANEALNPDTAPSEMAPGQDSA